MTLAFVVVGTLAFWFTAWVCRENVVRMQARITIRETVVTLKANRPLAYLCAASFFYLIGLFAVGGASAFYAQYVLHNIGMVGLITLVNTGVALLITPVIPKIIDKLGKKTVFQYCGLFTVAGGLGLFFTPGNVLWLVLITLAIKGVGASLINTVMFGLEADTVEYGEWKTGKRSEGATYALFSFTRKVTQSIGGHSAHGRWPWAATSRRAPPTPTRCSRTVRSSRSRRLTPTIGHRAPGVSWPPAVGSRCLVEPRRRSLPE